MMRFRGGGVGHKSTREATDFFKNDRDRLDTQTVTATEAEDDNNMEGYASGTEIMEDEEDDYGYGQEVMDSDDSSVQSEDDDYENFGYADL